MTGVASKIRRAALLAKGIRPAVTPDRPVAIRFELLAPVKRLRAASAGDLVLAERSLPLADSKRSVRLTVSRRLRGAVKRGTRLKLRITATGSNGRSATLTRRIRVR